MWGFSVEKWYSGDDHSVFSSFIVIEDEYDDSLLSKYL